MSTAERHAFDQFRIGRRGYRAEFASGSQGRTLAFRCLDMAAHARTYFTRCDPDPERRWAAVVAHLRLAHDYAATARRLP